MKNFKAIQIFLTLSNKEIGQFEKFLDAFYKENIKLRTLFSVLKKERESLPILDKQSFLHKIMSKDYYSSPRHVTNTLSRLSKIIEEFLVHREIFELSIKEVVLLDIYKKRGLNNVYRKKMNNYQLKYLEKSSYSIYDYLEIGEIYRKSYLYDRVYHNKFDEYSLRKSFKYINTFSILQRLKFNIEILIRSNLRPALYEVIYEYDEAILSEAERLNQPIIKWYVNLNLALVSEEKKLTQELVEHFLKIESFSLVQEYHEILLYLIETCSLKKSSPVSKLRLYKFGVKKEILSPNNEISQRLFLDAVETALISEDFDFANYFISHNSDKLAIDKKRDTLYLSNALKSFYEGRFHETLRFVSQVPYKDLFQNVIIRSLTLKAFYEAEDDYFLLLDTIRSFRTYLSRQELAFGTYFTIESHDNFIKILKAIVMQKEIPESLEEKIRSLVNVAYEDWLRKILRR